MKISFINVTEPRQGQNSIQHMTRQHLITTAAVSVIRYISQYNALTWYLYLGISLCSNGLFGNLDVSNKNRLSWKAC